MLIQPLDIVVFAYRAKTLLQHKELPPQISPWLFFTLLLRHAQRDMEREAFTVEQHSRQNIVLFDSDRVVQLLAQKPIQDYRATILASFTRLEQITVALTSKRCFGIRTI
jgi:hypothetical protein